MLPELFGLLFSGMDRLLIWSDTVILGMSPPPLCRLLPLPTVPPKLPLPPLPPVCTALGVLQALDRMALRVFMQHFCSASATPDNRTF